MPHHTAEAIAQESPGSHMEFMQKKEEMKPSSVVQPIHPQEFLPEEMEPPSSVAPMQFPPPAGPGPQHAAPQPSQASAPAPPAVEPAPPPTEAPPVPESLPSSSQSASAHSPNFGHHSPQDSAASQSSPKPGSAAAQASWLEQGKLKKVGENLPALRDVKDSVEDIAGGPGEKEISGTSNSMFQDFVNHDDSDIGEVLAQAIDNLNATAFNLPFSVSIAFPGIQDTPLIGISEGFLQLSGYSRDEIVGQNCRLLLKGVPAEQVNKDVRQEARRYCKAAHLRGLSKMSHSLLLQRNARKNGELFWNLFMLSVLPGPNGRNYVIGLQLDLGADLPEVADRANMESQFFSNHRENLISVQKAMLGNKPKRQPGQGSEAEDLEEEMGLAEDIQNWLSAASKRAGTFQKIGTLPFVAWPTCRNHALLNGGSTLLRLEADRVKAGAVAMSIFPVSEKPDGSQYFKIQVDDICPVWGVDVHKGSMLPTMGFTLMNPTQVDEMGGLPPDIGAIPETVVFKGDGAAFAVAPDCEGMGEAVKQFAERKAKALCPYTIQNGDLVECIWSKRSLRVEVQGKVIMEVKDMVIFDPKGAQAYAVFDLCGAVCRATLMQ
eukprot:gnl/MRDRNA2_/MRDRNA2_61025_c0_seq3.p1 gnl/MRDRNA2_/MRDRNA2_61025_c0~~gnl/MRDRNA2_/MRDRNA2_61025_c0_seq3.p1  ORF type:complete len:604 (+),score=129.60 gnl/MRDRNA2_/MRDRNA2_61025_c0_seq3:2-1813(+)